MELNDGQDLAASIVREPVIVPVTIDVCELCLRGMAGECHSPGCIFWMCPAPSTEQAERLRAGHVQN